jgi:hypothetical protein
MKRNTIELVMVGIVCLIMTAFAYAVLDEGTVQEQDIQYEARKYPPSIPQCDKELWDRIREGCD